MTEILGKVLPLFFLIGLGAYLGRIEYFGEQAFSKLQSLVLNIALPCLLCTTFITLDVDLSYAWLSVAFFGLMLLLLGVGFLVARAMPRAPRYLPFLFTSFGFGTVAIPFYVALFGQENLKYLSVLGVGHEVFVAVLFLPLAHMYLSESKFTPKLIAKSLCSPFLIMTFLGIAIRVSGLREPLFHTALGQGLYGSLERLGSISLTLTLIIIGYRLKLSDLTNLRRSALYVAMRYAVTLTVAFLFKPLVIDRMMAPNPLLDAAYLILLLQHSSIALTVMVGKYRPREEHEEITNFFVINTIVGILAFLAYSLTF